MKGFFFEGGQEETSEDNAKECDAEGIRYLSTREGFAVVTGSAVNANSTTDITQR